MKNFVNYLGVDVSKNTLDIHAMHGKEKIFYQRVRNDAKGYREFAKSCKEYGITPEKTLLCLENTGSYGEHLAVWAQKNKYNIWIESPMAIKKSLGIVRGKNDKIDAKRIALYAVRFEDQCKLWQQPRSVIYKLKKLQAARKRLMTAKNRIEVPLKEVSAILSKKEQKEIANFNKPAIEGIKKSLKAIDKKIAELIKKDEKLSRLLEVATSVDGVGPQIALAFIIATDEFQYINESRKLSCYAGVAPFEYSSGTSVRGKSRVSHMANKSLKTVLHMGALSAIQNSQELKAYYERKVKEGKPKLSIINAIKNKLIARMCACVRDNRKYEKNYTKNFVMS